MAHLGTLTGTAQRRSAALVRLLLLVFALTAGIAPCHIRDAQAAGGAPTPLLADGQPVDWWFVFKFNTACLPEKRMDRRAAERVFGGYADRPSSSGAHHLATKSRQKEDRPHARVLHIGPTIRTQVLIR